MAPEGLLDDSWGDSWAGLLEAVMKSAGAAPIGASPRGIFEMNGIMRTNRVHNNQSRL
jgi:hypothetical protein